MNPQLLAPLCNYLPRIHLVNLCNSFRNLLETITAPLNCQLNYLRASPTSWMPSWIKRILDPLTLYYPRRFSPASGTPCVPSRATITGNYQIYGWSILDLIRSCHANVVVHKPMVNKNLTKKVSGHIILKK